MATNEIYVGKISYQLFQLCCVDAIHWAFNYSSELKLKQKRHEYEIHIPSQYEIKVYKYYSELSEWYDATEIILKYENEKIIINIDRWSDNESDEDRWNRLNLLYRIFSKELQESFIGSRSETNIKSLKALPCAFNPITVTRYKDTTLSTNVRLIPGFTQTKFLKDSKKTYPDYVGLAPGTFFAYNNIRRIIYNESSNTMDVERQTAQGDILYHSNNYKPLCDLLNGTGIQINKPILLSEKNNPTKKTWCCISLSGMILDNNIIKSTLETITLDNKLIIFFKTRLRVITIVCSSGDLLISDYRLTTGLENPLPIVIKSTFNYNQRIKEIEELDEEIDKETAKNLEKTIEQYNTINELVLNASKHIRQEITTEYVIDETSNLNETEQVPSFIRDNISEINELPYLDGTEFVPFRGGYIEKYVLNIKKEVAEREKYEAWAEQHPFLDIFYKIIDLLGRVFK